MIQLRIKDNTGIVQQDFGIWLIPKIKLSLLANIKKFNFSQWNEFLTTSDKLTRLYKKDYTVSEIVEFASKNLQCSNIVNGISIHFKNNVVVPGFDRLNLNAIIKTINYGTLDTKPCPIFTATMNEYAENINEYARVYYDV